MGITYRDSGVDIDKGDRFVEIIKEKLSEEEKKSIGLFGGVYYLSTIGYKNPVLVSSTDGVGTKLILARLADNYKTIGIDLVAMCVNDIVTLGAKPLFFLDYMATAELDLNRASDIVDGIIKGCRESGCALLGGETAEMPGVYNRGDYELAGFVVGIAEKNKLITGKDIDKGDAIIGIPSSGIHSNGISLARKALFEIKSYKPDMVFSELGGIRLIDELLKPTRIYVSLVMRLIEKYPIKGIAHITGGGLYSNILRLLPEELDIAVEWSAVKPHPIFNLIREAGDIDIDEMRRTFNMGVGLALIVDSYEASSVVEFLRKEMNERAEIIGSIVKK